MTIPPRGTARRKHVRCNDLSGTSVGILLPTEQEKKEERESVHEHTENAYEIRPRRGQREIETLENRADSYQYREEPGEIPSNLELSKLANAICSDAQDPGKQK